MDHSNTFIPLIYYTIQLRISEVNCLNHFCCMWNGGIANSKQKQKQSELKCQITRTVRRSIIQKFSRALLKNI